MDSLLPASFDLEKLFPGNGRIRQEHSTANPDAQGSAQIPVFPLVPPSIQDDPVLETIMRQAQMGLYAQPTLDSELNDEQHKDSDNNSFLL